jgi:hypothetical protein
LLTFNQQVIQLNLQLLHFGTSSVTLLTRIVVLGLAEFQGVCISDTAGTSRVYFMGRLCEVTLLLRKNGGLFSEFGFCGRSSGLSGSRARLSVGDGSLTGFLPIVTDRSGLLSEANNLISCDFGSGKFEQTTDVRVAARNLKHSSSSSRRGGNRRRNSSSEGREHVGEFDAN